MMIKLYRRDDTGALHYHEAWVDDDEIIEHWGAVGDRGETRRYQVRSGTDRRSRLDSVMAGARAGGFTEYDPEALVGLAIVYEQESGGTVADGDVRNEVGALLDEELGWTGLGHWDGGNIGSATTEVHCTVVDFDIAKRVVSEALADTDLPPFARIEKF